MKLVLMLTRILCLGYIGLGLICSGQGLVTSIDDEVNLQQLYNRMTGRRITSYQQRRIQPKSNAMRMYSVSIDSQEAKFVVDRRFLSTGIGTKELTYGTWFDPKSLILQTLLKGLSPAVFRVGGRPGDETLFIANNSYKSISDPWRPVNFYLTGEHWKSLNEFTTKCGVDLAFTLNLVLRKGLDWDPTNAKELLDFNADLGYRVIWQLGNEPLNFKKNYNMTISAEQLAKDFITLRRILSEDRYRYSNELNGPDFDHLPLHHDSDSLINDAYSYLKSFLQKAGNTINATSVHFYNIKNDISNSIDNFTDPDVLIRTRYELQRFRQVIKESMPIGSRVKWLGETSSVTGGGLHAVSNRYVGGFLILHNLGVAAEMGVSIFVYWSFFSGGSYSLVRHMGKVSPKALYWPLFMHKRLLGTHVLSVSYTIEEDMASNEKNISYVHVFAHCTRISSLYGAGSVTLMALNLHNDTKVSLKLTGHLADKNIDEYLLEPYRGSLVSDDITLNGHLLQMKNDTHFPDIIPRPLSVGSPIVLPPRTYGFYVIKDAHAHVCHNTKPYFKGSLGKFRRRKRKKEIKKKKI